MIDVDGRILSIQSHVAFGYVGGKAAVFPLQCLGFDVDVINTVNFSNHSGYPSTGGSKSNASDLQDMFNRLEDNELLAPKRFLTGYIPGAESVAVVGQLAENLKTANPELIYLLDPVMGDAGRMYVAPDVVPIYREMLKLANVITPNWFEVELLTEIPLTNPSSLQKALRKLHDHFKVPNVVITSIPLSVWLVDMLPPSIKPTDPDSQFLLCMCSSSTGQSSDPIVHARCFPFLPGYFSGVGDLFSAFLLAHFKPIPGLLPEATSYAVNKTHTILQRTSQYASNLPENERFPSDDEMDKSEPTRKSRRMRGRELRLVQSMDVITGQSLEMREVLPWTNFWKLA